MQVWNMAQKKDTLWVRWVAGVYLKGDELWQHIPPDQGSWYWKKVVEVRDVLKHGFSNGVWQHNASGEYTISSCYLWLLGQKPKFDLRRAIWHSHALPRHSFLLWLVAKGRLYTLDRLCQWNLGSTCIVCCLCSSHDESHAHLFFECDYSQQLMDLACEWLQLQRVPRRFNAWRHWLTHLMSASSWRQKTRAACLAAVAYHIWSERNARRHGSPEQIALRRFTMLKREVLVRVMGTKSKLAVVDRRFLQHLKA